MRPWSGSSWSTARFSRTMLSARFTLSGLTTAGAGAFGGPGVNASAWMR